MPELANRQLTNNFATSELFQADPFYAAELLAEFVRDGTADELAILERQLTANSCHS